MQHATKINGAWALVYPGIPFVDATGISRPGNWLDLASEEEKDEAEVYAVPDPDPPPTGKVEASRDLVGEDRPRLEVTYQDAPPPVLPSLPDISDRQFGRGLWGESIITFAECEAFVSVGAIPAALQAIIDDLPDDDTGTPTPRKDAILLVKGAKSYAFANPLVETVRLALVQTDPVWTVAHLRKRWAHWATL